MMKELEAEGIPYDPETEIGIIIETPASIFVAEELAKLVDFFSVGTNDLTQYTLACDRQANDLGKFYDPHHPALLRAIKMATDAAHVESLLPTSACSPRSLPWVLMSCLCPRQPCCDPEEHCKNLYAGNAGKLNETNPQSLHSGFQGLYSFCGPYQNVDVSRRFFTGFRV